MNAQLTARLLRVVPQPATVAHKPLTLRPIQWGTPDAALARGVCRHLIEATPALVIPANPLSHARLRAWLRSNHIEH
jgi:hypothetical protein